MLARQWSPYQAAIFNFVEAGTGNAIVEAVAGSGKTTTIEEASRRSKGSTLFLAFNKAIATELKNRGVNARTFHSLCYAPVTSAKRAPTVTPDKLGAVLEQQLGDADIALYGTFAKRLVGIARQSGVGCLTPDTPDTWAALAEHYDIELQSETADFVRGCAVAADLLRWSNASPLVDFDDLLYCAVKDGIKLPRFDVVFVDEAQDTNAIQRAILRKIMHEGSRLIAVGDPAQAIYGFRGADSDALDLIAEEFQCIRLPLSVTYRCPTAVVEHARRWVSHIEPAPGAPQGAVTALGTDWTPARFTPKDLVVCRTTKPLVALAYKCLRDKVGCRVLGREIGQGLIALVNRMRAKGIEQLIAKLTAYTEREQQKAIAKKNEAKAAAIADKTECVLVLIEGLDETARTIPELIRTIDSLFSDRADGTLTLATIHKAKGLEAQRVFWLNASACPAKWARQDWQQAQERNLCYVATTRAGLQLFLIEEARK